MNNIQPKDKNFMKDLRHKESFAKEKNTTHLLTHPYISLHLTFP